MKIRRARVDGGESLCAATPENIGRKRCCHIADVASKATLAVITSIALVACNNTSTTVPPTTESSMEASILTEHLRWTPYLRKLQWKLHLRQMKQRDDSICMERTLLYGRKATPK